MLIGTFSGVVLAGGHVLSWNVEFSNEKGRVLWRAYSLCLLAGVVSLGVPLLIASKLNWSETGQRTRCCNWIYRGFMSLVNGVALVGLFAYIIARVVLFYLTVQTFSNLPAGVYDEISWLQYIPYFH